MAINSFDNFKKLDKYTNQEWLNVANLLMRASGLGSYDSQVENFMGQYDRYRSNILPTNAEHAGYTFISRPRLNLQTGSLRQDRAFAPLDGNRAEALPFAIRAYLDTKLCRMDKYIDNVEKSPYIDSNSPWFMPLMNGLVGISGWPDPVMQTTTTDPGFHSEDMTTALGHDDLSKTYDLSLTFKDIQGGPIAAIFFYWLRYMHNLVKGKQIAYADDIDNQRLNYTVSIYRFTLDPTRKVITKYAKATGCFPKSVPLGAMFNFGEGELFQSAAGKFTIPFTANKIEYMDYGILQDFNILSRRYWPDIAERSISIDAKTDARGNLVRDERKRFVNGGDSALNNFRGRPYINLVDGNMRMEFKVSPFDKFNFLQVDDPNNIQVPVDISDVSDFPPTRTNVLDNRNTPRNV